MDERLELTRLLEEAAGGDRAALDHVFSVVYAELRHIAGLHRHGWKDHQTMNTTALVHEAYMKLASADSVNFTNRAHFMAVASKAMRQALVSYARMKNAERRGSGAPHTELHDELQGSNPLTHEAALGILEVHDALERLEELNERQARVVEARFFGGLDLEATAEAVGVSLATVKRDWALASAWLYRELTPPG